MPEHQQRVTSGHEQFEELCALGAGGLLEEGDIVGFDEHLKNCDQCRATYQELSILVTRELPRRQGEFRLKLAEIRTRPLEGARQRFIRRARAEGVAFSHEIDTPARAAAWSFRPITLVALVAALVLVAITLAIVRFRERPDVARAITAAQQIADLKRENSTLNASVSQSIQALATSEKEIQSLRSQLAEATVLAESLRRNHEQVRGEAERSSSQNAQLLDEARNQEKLLAEARDEAARSSQLRINDEGALVEQQARITELTNKLRIASATLDQERQLAAAGKDVRELMASRQLHVIDVRDTDPNGKPGTAFGRVFLTEGKSLAFYAFDLNQESTVPAKGRFQVWAVASSGKNSSRSLGFLHADARAPGRWVLTVDIPELLKQISGVFVTAGPATGAKEPSTQKLLYAYLGESNHP